MLLYIHGYKGEPGWKADLVRKVFGDMYDDIQAPQLKNINAFADLAVLNALLPGEDGTIETMKYPHLIVGNSLGGFYAWNIAQNREDCMCLMINPSLIPFISFKKFKGITTKFLKQLFCCFDEMYLNDFPPKIWATYCLDDESINHKETTELILKQPKSSKWMKTTLFPVDAGGHGFENVDALEKVFVSVKKDIQANNYFMELNYADEKESD